MATPVYSITGLGGSSFGLDKRARCTHKRIPVNKDKKICPNTATRKNPPTVARSLSKNAPVREESNRGEAAKNLAVKIPSILAFSSQTNTKPVTPIKMTVKNEITPLTHDSRRPYLPAKSICKKCNTMNIISRSDE